MARYRGIPRPGHTLRELLATIEALRENVELLTGQRGEAGRALTAEDVVTATSDDDDDTPPEVTGIQVDIGSGVVRFRFERPRYKNHDRTELYRADRGSDFSEAVLVARTLGYGDTVDDGSAKPNEHYDYFLRNFSKTQLYGPVSPVDGIPVDTGKLLWEHVGGNAAPLDHAEESPQDALNLENAPAEGGATVGAPEGTPVGDYDAGSIVDEVLTPGDRADQYQRWNGYDGLPGDGRFHAPIWGGPDGGTKLIESDGRSIESGLLREPGGVALNRSLAKASAADPDGLNGVPNRLVDYLTDTASFARVTAAALTSNQPDLSKAGIINKTADQIAETAAKKWAGETGADVTGAHTSADTSNVAGRAAGTVRDESRNGHNLTVAGSGQTLGDPRNQAFVQIGNRNSVQSSTSLLTGVDEGGGLGARIDVAAHTLYIGGVNLSMPSGSIIASSSTTYYVYADVDALNPGSTTYAASTSYARTYGNKHRYYVGKITTPSSGGGNTGGGGGGGTIPP